MAGEKRTARPGKRVARPAGEAASSSGVPRIIVESCGLSGGAGRALSVSEMYAAGFTSHRRDERRSAGEMSWVERSMAFERSSASLRRSERVSIRDAASRKAVGSSRSITGVS